MKKYLLGVVCLSFVGISLANTCNKNFTSKEIQNIQTIHNILDQKGVQLDKLVSHPDLQKVSSELRETIVAKLAQTANCRTMLWYYDFDTVKDDIINYVKEIKEFQQLDKELSNTKYTTAENAMIVLQQQILAQVNRGWIWDSPWSQEATMNFMLDFQLPGQEIFAEGLLNQTVEADLENSKIHSIIEVDGSWNANMWFGIAMTGALAGGLDQLTIGDTTYIKTLPFIAEGATIDMIGQFQDIIDILDSQYLEINTTQEDTILPGADLNSILETINLLQNTSLLTFYHKEWNTYYGTWSTDACDILYSLIQDVYIKNTCLQEIKEMLIHSNGKGAIFLKTSGDTYSLGMSDQFITDEDTLADIESDDIISAFVNTDIVTWNSNKITAITLDMGENNGIFYNYPMLNIIFNDPYNTLTIEGEVIAEKVDITLSWEGEDNYEDTPSQATINIVASENDGKEIISITGEIGTSTEVWGTFSLNGESKIISKSSLNLTPPTNTITEEKFEIKMMELYETKYLEYDY